MRAAALLLALLVAIAGASLAFAADPVPPRLSGRSATIASLTNALRLVDRASAASGPDAAVLAAQARDLLGQDGSLPNQAWLVSPLRATPPDLAGAHDRLTAELAALSVPGSRSPDPTIARQALADTLADPRYHPRTLLSYLPDWLVPAALLIGNLVKTVVSIVRWPFDRLLELLARFLVSPAFGPLMIVLALAAIVGVTMLYWRGLGSAISRQAEAPSLLADLPPTAADALTLAQGRAAEANYREACHFIFLFSLLWIEEHGSLRFDRAATNREQLLRLRTPDGSKNELLVSAFEPVVRRFDRIWYGQAGVGESDYREIAELAERVREVIP